jgi:hypothetical protein
MFESSPPSIKFIALRQSFEADFCLARGVYDAELYLSQRACEEGSSSSSAGGISGCYTLATPPVQYNTATSTSADLVAGEAVQISFADFIVCKHSSGGSQTPCLLTMYVAKGTQSRSLVFWNICSA